MESKVPGFDDVPDISAGEKPKTASKKGGGFQSMGLSFPILKGITRRGYKVPTPIQRKTIPLILEGRDVVAMARTGSGKTACFLIPMFEKLRERSAKAGARALVMSPTRELALQTQKFIKELGTFTSLKSVVILGGDSMDDQFEAIHGMPDVIVATPGRFLHLCIEMDLKLNHIEYVVFDEADRLFEMGFGEQMNNIIAKLPDARQTVLFSATLPKVLVEFAKAGLSDPVLIRLDVETKLPDELELAFLSVRPDEKMASLLALLQHRLASRRTIVFAATKHHVEYLHQVLSRAGIDNTYIYSDLDPSARKLHASRFSSGRCPVLVVTDVAARGIDVPLLDCVVNYNFPAKPKLFVHRVGRCARAGRTGTAYSLVGPDELAHLVDLHLFLGRPLEAGGAFGRLPQDMVEEQQTALLAWHRDAAELQAMQRVCENAYKKYMTSRPAASTDSNRRAKEMGLLRSAGVHPMFEQQGDAGGEEHREDLLARMANYRPQGTIFEVGTKTRSADYMAMKAAKKFHQPQVLAHKRKLASQKQLESSQASQGAASQLAASDEVDISATFSSIILPKKRRVVRDAEHFVPYKSVDEHTEAGLAVNTFEKDAAASQLELQNDAGVGPSRARAVLHWDRKKKKLTRNTVSEKAGKIRTESGAWIPATYKSDRYKRWQEKTKVDRDLSEDDDEENGGEASGRQAKRLKSAANKHWARHNAKLQDKKRRSELKTPDQILKARKIKEKRQQRNGRKPKGKRRKRNNRK